MRHPSGIRSLLALGLLVGSVALVGCPKRPEVIQAAPAPTGPPAATVEAPPPAPAPEPPRVVEAPPPAPVPAPEPAPVAQPAPPPAPAPVPATAPLQDVFFDFDKSVIRGDQKTLLNDDAGWLKGNSDAKVLIEGHCDERGTAEYNLALGERRAKAVKDYLIAAGIAADRISTISYGKERPFVLGHDESAWKWNRRGHMVLTGR